MRTPKAEREQLTAAAEIAAALAQLRKLIVPEGTPFPLLSLGDVLIYGAIMAQMASANSPAKNPGEGVQRIHAWSEEFTAAMRMGRRKAGRAPQARWGPRPNDAQWWADCLFREMEKDPTNAQDMRMATFQALAILEKPHLLRRAITRLIKEKLPPAPEGGQRLIGPNQLPDLLRRSDQWLSIAKAIAGLTSGGTAIPLREILTALNRRYPNECAVLGRSPARAEAVLAHRPVASVKSLDAKARRLVDALAGAEFNLSPAYAVKRAQAERARVEAPRAQRSR
ncbi:MAG: hypothetical protein ACRD1Y_03780 [Terriglobales bacterium]